MKPARIAVTLWGMLVASACVSSYADPHPATTTSTYASVSAPERDDLAAQRAPAPVEPAVPLDSPYGLELVGADLLALPRYSAHGRSYVLGSIGDRYRIHLTNPTSRRVEAVVSVDGLDAIDGKTANHETKRGYVIPPFGEVTLDGFRTALDQVATFRFSSVRDSYAGRKDQDRNVGVIGVAFYPEREVPVRMAPRPIARDDEPAPAPEGRAAGGAGNATLGAPQKSSARRERAGLGTEFGELRYSAVQSTSFQRDNPTHPQAIAQLRYNDRQGLLALGIAVDGRVESPDDLSLRESADPFPQNRFASPPPAR